MTSNRSEPAAANADSFGDAVRHLQSGRLAEAEALCRRLLAREPAHVGALHLLGVMAQRHGRLTEAATLLGRACALLPNDAQLRCDLANVLAAQELPVEAIGEFQQALRCDPLHAAAGRRLRELVDGLLAAVRGDGGAEAKILFVLAVENLSVIPDGLDLRAALIEALTEPWGRPASLLGVSTTVLRKNAPFRDAIKRARAAWPRRLTAAEVFAEAGRAAITNDALLRCLLEATRICDIGFERLLTNLRGIVLDAAIGGDADTDALAFAVALAQQCYLNDYVYDLTDDEAARAVTLREHVADALRCDAQIPPAWIAAVAAYFPLHGVPHSEKLLARSELSALAALLEQQIVHPADELRLRAQVPQLTPIEGRVSLDVARQYTENPYPNWVRLPLIDRPTTLDVYLGGLFPQGPFRPLGKAAAEILIAGCGTGQQALDAANLFADARLLAIDLSLPSLAFAQRKARELGLANIAFAQADILKLGAIEQRFDSIEAVGVLHHLADPWAGWSVLLGLLAPGGVMRVGLYSALARQDVVRARRIIAERGYRATPADILRARQELIARANAEQLLFVRDSWDFYSVSECRDLLFHVQEHQTSLPRIQAFLAAQGLRFLGFELNAATWNAYAARFPGDPAQIDLDAWHRFEIENPRTFAGMYSFWVQKGDA